jgi:processive 1,2-diacylglycerol beta-glucosyltransferase
MKKNKKILLVSVSTGSGHIRAAEALEKTAKKKYKHLTVEHIDMMNYVSTPIRKSVIESYDIMAKQLPNLWGFFYKTTNKQQLLNQAPKFAKLFNQINTGAFFNYIKKFEPDHILCTHFLPIHALFTMNKKIKLTCPISILMTDYHNHAFQTSPNISRYFISTEKMQWKLMSAGIDKKNITISGIPIDPVFYKQKKVNKLKNKYKATSEQKNLLILSGGQGLVDTNNIVSALFKSKQKIKIFTIAGKNKKLKNQLDKLKAPKNIKLNVIGWTDKIDEYIRIADLIITKPGGLTTTECISLNKPIIAISPIPGQEEYNAEYLLENQLGVIARDSDELLFYVETNPPQLKTRKKIHSTKKKSSEIILDKISK